MAIKIAIFCRKFLFQASNSEDTRSSNIEAERDLLMKLVNVAALVAGSLSLVGCRSSSIFVASNWNARPIIIDGEVAEWPSTGWKEEKDVRFNIVNDSGFIYVAVVVVKPELRRQIAMQGMTVWFDPNGREKKSFGIRYPLGGFGGRVFNRDGATEFPSEPAQFHRDSSDERTERSFRSRHVDSEFEYMSPYDPNRERVPLLAAEGVEITFDNWGDSLVYEMRIPIHPAPNHHYTAEAGAGMKIAVGIDVSIDRPAGGNFSGGRPPEGGRTGGSGGRGGGFGGRGSGMGRGGSGRGGGGGQRSSNTPSPVELWARVQLAASPTH